LRLTTGTPAGRPFCGLSRKTAFVERNTDAAGVPLAPNGDFRIDDVLSPAPQGCASPVLLIRNAVNRTWFGAGIPQLED
jgi:hypothetical protein